MNVLLRVENITKYYGTQTNTIKAVNNISFNVHEGEFISIMGSSGSGKTTLLNCISTIDTVDSGKIYLDGENISDISIKNISKFRRENLGFIFQDFNLLDTLTLYENIALALTINKVNINEIYNNIYKIAKTLNINDILNKFPYEVSGGQKQRCACARAIINKPKIILADEPTGALDSNSSQMLLKTIRELNDHFKTTIIMVTHDTFSASYTKRILFLEDGKIFNEITRDNKTQKEFFHEIINTLQSFGGDLFDVF